MIQKRWRKSWINMDPYLVINPESHIINMLCKSLPTLGNTIHSCKQISGYHELDTYFPHPQGVGPVIKFCTESL
jgi:hypothetical protein